MNKMELLDFLGNSSMQGDVVSQLNGITNSSNQLETVVIVDGCVGIQKFSFRECAKMKNILLSGLFKHLRILDLSGTAIKTLDLSAMTARSLNELFLNDCHKLCAILWPPEDKRKRHLQKLHIDTTWSSAPLISMKEKSTEGITAANVTTSSASLSVTSTRQSALGKSSVGKATFAECRLSGTRQKLCRVPDTRQIANRKKLKKIGNFF
jgi:hypothetical protein